MKINVHVRKQGKYYIVEHKGKVVYSGYNYSRVPPLANDRIGEIMKEVSGCLLSSAVPLEIYPKFLLDKIRVLHNESDHLKDFRE